MPSASEKIVYTKFICKACDVYWITETELDAEMNRRDGCLWCGGKLEVGGVATVERVKK